MKETAVMSFVVLALLLGGLFTYVAFPRNVEVPGETINNTIVEYVNTTNTVVVDKFADLAELAFAEYVAELEDDDDLLICGGEQYDFDQVDFRNKDDLTMSVDTSDEDDTITVITFKQKLKFSDKDVETKCYRTDLVTVTFHSDEDEDTEVSID